MFNLLSSFCLYIYMNILYMYLLKCIKKIFYSFNKMIYYHMTLVFKILTNTGIKQILYKIEKKNSHHSNKNTFELFQIEKRILIETKMASRNSNSNRSMLSKFIFIIIYTVNTYNIIGLYLCMLLKSIV